MNTKAQTPRSQRSTGAIVLEFLGSMNLAITLLVVIAVASVIGTVLKQSQPSQDYVIKFGPFWSHVFHEMGLFSIYSSAWFLTLMAFLVVSITVCVWRNMPQMVREMRQFRLDAQEKSLRGFHLNDEWTVAAAPAEAMKRAAAYFSNRGYRVRHREGDDHLMLAGMKGAVGRWGYLLSHMAIVVICVGGLADGNIPRKIETLTGKLKVETRDLPVHQVPAASTLPPTDPSFRGDVSIPEGSSANFVFLNMGDGYLLQKLPFTIAVKKFHIEHYPTGQPKSFVSDLVIYDDGNKAAKPLNTSIEVNHPLHYKGYTIYQASFSDGGSKLDLKLWPLNGSTQALDLHGTVNHDIKLKTAEGPLTVEFTNFKMFNVFPVQNDPTGKRVRNYGPSVIFKVRDATGAAKEYTNFQLPIKVGGRYYYLSGVRNSPAEPYMYLHIPLDANMSIKQFLRFEQAALDSAKVRKVVAAQTAESLAKIGKADDTAMKNKIVGSVTDLVSVFMHKGIDGVTKEVAARVPKKKRADVLSSYVKVLQGTLGGVYVDLLRQEGVDLSKGITQQQSNFFDDSLNAFSLLGGYGSPFYLQLTNFHQIQASGLEVTRDPGKNIVYLGCLMLVAGVFLMFYIHHRRIWLRVASEGEGSRLLFAGSGNRDRTGFTAEFEALRNDLHTLFTTKPNNTDQAR